MEMYELHGRGTPLTLAQKWLRANWGLVIKFLYGTRAIGVYANRSGTHGSCAIVEVNCMYVEFESVRYLFDAYPGLNGQTKKKIMHLIRKRLAEYVTQWLLSEKAVYYQYAPHLMYVGQHQDIERYIPYLEDAGWMHIEGYLGPHTSGDSPNRKLHLFLFIPKKKVYAKVTVQRERLK
jgi:hypothetical protein